MSKLGFYSFFTPEEGTKPYRRHLNLARDLQKNINMRSLTANPIKAAIHTDSNCDKFFSECCIMPIMSDSFELRIIYVKCAGNKKMVDEIFNIFKENLPDIVRSDEVVKRILSDTNNHIISCRDGGKLTGVSVMNGNTIYLLCVDRPFQNRGIGTELLNQSEKYAVSHGFNKVVVGAGKDYIMPGIPMNNGAHIFFKEHGYIHSWGDCGCFDMSQMLKDFKYDEHSIGDVINGIMYRWATIDDIDKIVECVSDAKESFVPYYQDEKLYEKGTSTLVLIAEKNNDVLGTLMVGMETEGKNMGNIGCTATVNAHRNKGIGTNLIMLGTKYLKDIGLCKATLGYTYTYILNLYGRAGYIVSMEYYMGEKAVGNVHV